jgi:uncharacterized protein (DUF427 family)
MDQPAKHRSIENVGDYPRPPRVEDANMPARIWIGDHLICDARNVVRVLETFHPPGIYLASESFAPGVLQASVDRRATYCEFKGTATYFDLHGPDGTVLERAAWTYEHPIPGFERLAGLIAVYPARMARCTLDGETVTPQPGDFYGGWATSWIRGPIKGAPGTTHW